MSTNVYPRNGWSLIISMIWIDKNKESTYRRLILEIYSSLSTSSRNIHTITLPPKWDNVFTRFCGHFKVQRVNGFLSQCPGITIGRSTARSCIDCAESSGILIGHDTTAVSFSELANNKVMHENTSWLARRGRNIRKSPDVWSRQPVVIQYIRWFHRWTMMMPEYSVVAILRRLRAIFAGKMSRNLMAKPEFGWEELSI